MRYLSVFLLSLVLAVGLVGCDSSDNGGAASAEVRFMHASPGAGPVNVVVGGEEVASNVSYSGQIANPTVSQYYSVPVDADPDIVVEDANGNPVITTSAGDINLEADNKYTVVVAGAASAPNAPSPIVLRDETRDLGDDEVGIRIIHGSAFAGAVDVYLTDPGTTIDDSTPALVSDFSFTDDFPGGFTGQFAPQAVSGSGSVLTVTQAGSTTPVLQLEVGTGSSNSLPVTAGQYITGVAVDDPGSNPPVSALIQLDASFN